MPASLIELARFLQKKLTFASSTVSSRHLMPGPIALSAAAAAGEEATTAATRALLAPMGPGVKPRGDSLGLARAGEMMLEAGRLIPC